MRSLTERGGCCRAIRSGVAEKAGNRNWLCGDFRGTPRPSHGELAVGSSPALICLGREMQTAAGGQGGEDPQASSAKPPDFHPRPSHQRHNRRLEQRHRGAEVSGTRLFSLASYRDSSPVLSNPVLEREARPQVGATLPLKCRQNPERGACGAAHVWSVIGSPPQAMKFLRDVQL